MGERWGFVWCGTCAAAAGDRDDGTKPIHTLHRAPLAGVPFRVKLKSHQTNLLDAFLLSFSLLLHLSSPFLPHCVLREDEADGTERQPNKARGLRPYHERFPCLHSSMFSSASGSASATLCVSACAPLLFLSPHPKGRLEGPFGRVLSCTSSTGHVHGPRDRSSAPCDIPPSKQYARDRPFKSCTKVSEGVFDVPPVAREKERGVVARGSTRRPIWGAPRHAFVTQTPQISSACIGEAPARVWHGCPCRPPSLQ